MQTTPKRFGVAANEPKRSERLLQDRQQSNAPSLGSAQPQPHRHHVYASPRRMKTLDELRDKVAGDLPAGQTQLNRARARLNAGLDLIDRALDLSDWIWFRFDLGVADLDVIRDEVDALNRAVERHKRARR